MRITAPAPIPGAGYERRIVALFRSGHATGGESAQRLADLGLKDSVALRGMVMSAVLRKAGDRYFLDEAVWARRRDLKGNKVVRIAVVFGLIGLATMLYAIAGP